jgi:circadian clock protein KaiC
MLGGGLLQGSSTLVLGPAGSGKTSLGLAVAFEAVRRGEPATLVTFSEDPNQIVAVARKLGLDAPRAVAQGKLRHLYVSPIELDIDEHILRIVASVEESGSRCVVIDSLSDFESAAFDEARFRNYLFTLVQYFKDRGITAFMTYEGGSNGELLRSSTGVSRFADNVVRLRFADENGGFGHRLQVLKTRGSAHSYDVREFRITHEGVQLSPPRGKPAAERPPQR